MVCHTLNLRSFYWLFLPTQFLGGCKLICKKGRKKVLDKTVYRSPENSKHVNLFGNCYSQSGPCKFKIAFFFIVLYLTLILCLVRLKCVFLEILLMSLFWIIRIFRTFITQVFLIVFIFILQSIFQQLTNRGYI